MAPTSLALRGQSELAVLTAIALVATAFVGLLHAADASPTQKTVPDSPSLVRVSGQQLLVQRRQLDSTLGPEEPYVIKGVAWSPASTNTSQADLSAQFYRWYDKDIPLMAEMGVNTVRTFLDFGARPAADKVLDTFYRHGIMVIVPVIHATKASGATLNAEIINAYKNHPAILMWSLGNEWDLNRYGNQFSTTAQAAAFTETAARAAHDLDQTHPVASILGDIHRVGESRQPLRPLLFDPLTLSTEKIVNGLVPSVDVWGANIYRNASFGGLFDEWKQISAEPFFVAEFGADAYDHRVEAENQAMQSQFDGGLWDELFLELSANWPWGTGLGGLVFEWSDEWWKNGGIGLHDVSPEPNGGQPDLHNDEEWFGLVDIDRRPRQAFHQLAERFLGQGSVSVGRAITLSATSGESSSFSRNGAGFCHREGGGGGGRGINFATIDPSNGRIEACINFDTYWSPEQACAAADFCRDIPPNHIVLVALADEAGLNQAVWNPRTGSCDRRKDDPCVTRVIDCLKRLGSERIETVSYWGSWAMIARKGSGPLAEGSHAPAYAAPIAGSCQKSAHVSTFVTASLAITSVLPGRLALTSTPSGTPTSTRTSTPAASATPTSTQAVLATPTAMRLQAPLAIPFAWRSGSSMP